MSPTLLSAAGSWVHQNRIRSAIILGFGLVIAVVFSLGITPGGLFELLRENQTDLQDWIATHRWLGILGYTVFYVLMVSISLPGALWFTIGAGYLLGAPIGVAVSLIGITWGATNALLMVRYVLGPKFSERFEGRIARFAEGFRQNQFTYVVLLRLLPTPFFIVNVAAAMLGANWQRFTIGTLVGSVPAAILYSNMGAGLAELIAAGARPGLSDLTRPSFLIVLAMAGVLAIAPVIHHKWRARASR
jgi:uncharacterized membrane protein YdjX (TVP38/TMEM64 family)